MLYNLGSDVETFSKNEWKPSNLTILDFLTKPTSQALEKQTDGSIVGLRYRITTEPSTLRPVRSWGVNIERWMCDERANITATDIMFIRLLNNNRDIGLNYHDIIQDITIMDEKREINTHNAFNAMMATVLMITKIDSGRMPDVDKILSSYNLLD